MKSLNPRIMYIERKAGEISGEARIGRVTFNRTGKTICYQGKSFQIIKGGGFKSNYRDVETGEDYWISGCKKAGGDRLYPGTITIDEEVREEYWLEIRQEPERVAESVIHCNGRHRI